MGLITPILPYVHEGITLGAKREDHACFTSIMQASGAKVRQYMSMCNKAHPAAPLVVGCSAHSCQQLYVADAMQRTGRRGVVFVPARKEKTSATKFCESVGCEVHYVRPGHLSVVRKRARDYAKAYEGVAWDQQLAIEDTRIQAEAYTNSKTVYGRGSDRKIVLAVGSGATMLGLLVGLVKDCCLDYNVLGVRVSGMCNPEKLLDKFVSICGPVSVRGSIDFVDSNPLDYTKPFYDRDPSMDPYYTAKALPFVGHNDLLWVTGRRQIGALENLNG